MKAKRITVAYVRVSHCDQNDTLQRDAIQRWARANEVEVEWFCDHFTGRTMTRPGWQALWQRVVSTDEPVRVVCWKLDRLGRTASGLTKLFDDLRSRDIGFVSLTEGIDLSTAAGKMTASILASVAEFEREVRAERQMAAIASIRERNGGKCPWGGSKPGVPKKLNEDQVAFISKAKANGESVASIARTVGVSRQTVYRVLAWSSDSTTQNGNALPRAINPCELNPPPDANGKA